MYDADAYSDTPQGHPVPPLTTASTGDGSGGTGQMLGNDLATVGTGPNLPNSMMYCQKCVIAWIAITGALVLAVIYRKKIVR